LSLSSPGINFAAIICAGANYSAAAIDIIAYRRQAELSDQLVFDKNCGISVVCVYFLENVYYLDGNASDKNSAQGQEDVDKLTGGRRK